MPMKGHAKKPKYVAEVERRILGENIRRWMEWRYADKSDKYTALADATGNSRSSVQRWIKGEVGQSLDNIALVANALRCEAWQLLHPDERPPADRGQVRRSGAKKGRGPA